MKSKILYIILLFISTSCIKTQPIEINNTKWKYEIDNMLSYTLEFISEDKCVLKTKLNDVVFIQDLSYDCSNEILFYNDNNLEATGVLKDSFLIYHQLNPKTIYYFIKDE